MRRSLLLGGLILLNIATANDAAYARRYGRGYGGGTVAGSTAAGMGALIRAQGAYNQMTAQAMIAAEQAKSLSLENKLKTAQTFYQLRRLNENEQALQTRKELALYAPAPPTKIPRLTPDQFDPVSGRITWPAVLERDEFAAERTLLDELFLRRSINAAAVTNSDVEKLTDALRDRLDEERDHFSTPDFFSARHFLAAVDGESRSSGFEHAADPAVK
jgi:hypothetical protein